MPKNNEMLTRKMMLGGPATVNEEVRTVEAIMTTDTPVRVWDWDLGQVDEVLLMSGATFPEQVPLLDSHSRGSVADILGSTRGIRIEGNQMVGTVNFSATKDAEDAFIKVREGHLTDFSIGYLVTKSRFVPEDVVETIDGRDFTGPVKVATAWEVKELSICPIGADKLAKARSEAANKKESIVDETLEKKADVVEPIEPVSDPRDYVAEERTRAAEIMALGVRHDCQDMATEAVRSGKDLSDFQSDVLDHLSKKETVEAPAFKVEAGETDQEKFRSAAEESLLVRSGHSDKQNDLASLTLRELARESLVKAGNRATGGNVMEMIGRALTTSDFPKILANTANKSLAEGYATANETWSQWCATGSVSDFNTHTLVRAGETEDLVEIPEAAEYKYGGRSEEQEQYSIATYGKIFAISRQTIINDDLGALTDIPTRHGEAAARKVGDVAYAVLTANAAMGDGTALFAAGHGNKATSGAPMGITTLGAAVMAMKIQKDVSGLRRLNIRPQFILAPVALEVSTEQLLRSSLEGTQAKPNLVNPYSGSYFTRIYEPRLDDNDAAYWYLAGPKGKTVKVFFLNGNQNPYMETRNGWNVDGVEYKVRMDCGAKAVDWRALYMNEGD